MFHTPLYKRILSYLYPVRIRKSSGTHNSLLELFLYKGQFQLGTYDAMYSDGNRYRPAVLAADKLGDELNNVKTVLALGAGIGSIVEVLSHKGYKPGYTLVDIDSKILEWTKELHESKNVVIDTVCKDAGLFMKEQTATFDLLFADIFLGRVVPQFVTTETFLQKCRRGINPGGIFVMNYIINDAGEWETVERTIRSVFPACHIHSLEVNRIIIASV